jgi:hypothetical protein
VRRLPAGLAIAEHLLDHRLRADVSRTDSALMDVSDNSSDRMSGVAATFQSWLASFSTAALLGTVVFSMLSLLCLAVRPMPQDIYPSFALGAGDGWLAIGAFVLVNVAWFAVLGAAALATVFELARRHRRLAAAGAATVLQVALLLPACMGASEFLQAYRWWLVAGIAVGSMGALWALLWLAERVSADRRPLLAVTLASAVGVLAYLLVTAAGSFANLYSFLFLWVALWVQASAFLLVRSFGEPGRWTRPVGLGLVMLALLDPIGAFDERHLQIRKVFSWRCPEIYTALDLSRSAKLEWFKTKRKLVTAVSEQRETQLRAVPPSTEPKRQLDVVFFVIDAFRRDRLGFLSPEQPSTTPHIDRLAEQSLVYERAFSPSPTTGYSVVSLLSGLMPETVVRASTAPHMLPRVLRHHGYDTASSAAFSGLGDKFPVLSGLGSDEIGFETVADVPREMMSADYDARIVGSLLERFEQADRPRFEYIHLLGTHGPFRGDDAAADYDRAVRTADAQVGRLVERLEQQGRWDSVILVILGDHGESLGEHGMYAHSQALYQEQIAVPLIVRIPGAKPATIEQPVTLTTLPHIVMQALGASWPLEEHPKLAGERLNRTVAAQEFHVQSHLVWRSIQRPPYVYHHRYLTETEELYDLSRSPGEQDDIAASSPRLLEQFRELEAALEALERAC